MHARTSVDSLVSLAHAADFEKIKTIVMQANSNPSSENLDDIKAKREAEVILREINAVSDGTTALYWAVEHQNLETINLLIENGADATLGDDDKLPIKRALALYKEEKIDGITYANVAKNARLWEREHKLSAANPGMRFPITRVFRYMQEVFGRLDLKKVDGKDVVLFIGDTGAGKSTTIAHLVGATLNEEETDAGTSIAVLDSDSEIKGPKIGLSVESQTSIPEVFSTSSLELIDCPGFKDNRGALAQLISVLGIDSVIQRSRSVKGIVLAIKFAPDTKFGYIRNALTDIGKFFSKMNAAEARSLIFMLTHTLPRTKKPYLISKMQELIAANVRKMHFELAGDAEKVEAIKENSALQLILDNQDHLVFPKLFADWAVAPDSGYITREQYLKMLKDLPGLSKDSIDLSKADDAIIQANSALSAIAGEYIAWSKERDSLLANITRTATAIENVDSSLKQYQQQEADTKAGKDTASAAIKTKEKEKTDAEAAQKTERDQYKAVNAQIESCKTAIRNCEAKDEESLGRSNSDIGGAFIAFVGDNKDFNFNTDCTISRVAKQCDDGEWRPGSEAGGEGHNFYRNTIQTKGGFLFFGRSGAKGWVEVFARHSERPAVIAEKGRKQEELRNLEADLVARQARIDGYSTTIANISRDIGKLEGDKSQALRVIQESIANTENRLTELQNELNDYQFAKKLIDLMIDNSKKDVAYLYELLKKPAIKMHASLLAEFSAYFPASTEAAASTVFHGAMSGAGTSVPMGECVL